VWGILSFRCSASRARRLPQERHPPCWRQRAGEMLVALTCSAESDNAIARRGVDIFHSSRNMLPKSPTSAELGSRPKGQQAIQKSGTRKS
jgi:hypothetical protein